MIREYTVNLHQRLTNVYSRTNHSNLSSSTACRNFPVGGLFHSSVNQRQPCEESRDSTLGCKVNTQNEETDGL